MSDKPEWVKKVETVFADQGYDVVDFRVPVCGDTYGGFDGSVSDSVYVPCAPRFILQKRWASPIKSGWLTRSESGVVAWSADRPTAGTSTWYLPDGFCQDLCFLCLPALRLLFGDFELPPWDERDWTKNCFKCGDD